MQKVFGIIYTDSLLMLLLLLLQLQLLLLRLLPLPVVVVVMVVESALPQMLQLPSQAFHLASNPASLLVLSHLPSTYFLWLANLWDLKSANLWDLKSASRIWLQPFGSSSPSISLGSSLPTPSLFQLSTKSPCSV